MSPRTTRSLALGLVGSAALLTLFVSCNSCTQDPTQNQNYATGTGTHSTGYRRSYRSWGWGPSWGWGSSHSSGSSSHVGSSGSSSGGSRSGGSIGSTSRGGFGGGGSSSAS